MKTENNFTVKGGEAKETRAEKAIRLLTTAASNPFNQKLQEFKTFYPAIVTARHNGMKTKQVLKILAEGGLKLYPALFEKLMTAMSGGADTDTCPQCKQNISKQIEEPEEIRASVDELPSPVQAGTEGV